MPVLESPEVSVTSTDSGLTLFFQALASEEANQNDTDVGINTPTGNNVVINSGSLYTLPISGTPITTLSLYLSEEWHNKDTFIQDMLKTHKISIEEKPPIGMGANPSLCVRGSDNILTVLKYLRSSFETTAHDGAEIYRQVAHPALLGEIRDTVVAQREVSKAPKERNQFREAYGWVL